MNPVSCPFSLFSFFCASHSPWFEASTADDMAAPATAGARATDPSLHDFLLANSLQSLEGRLSGTTLRSCIDILFDSGRTALLAKLAECGLKLPERQKLANTLGSASRNGVQGVAESEEEIQLRTEWLARSSSSSSSGADEVAWCRPASLSHIHVCRRHKQYRALGRVIVGRSARRSPFFNDARGRDEFELVVCYYGDSPVDPLCMQVADRALRMKGGKFPNLLACLKRQLAYFRSFEAILVADDDLEGLDAMALSALFHARRQLNDAWVIQPANHSEIGKADIHGTRSNRGLSHRFVNFIEVTAPLFRTDKLLEFMRSYVPRRHDPPLLVGYGIDCWFCQLLLGAEQAGKGSCAHKDKAAVIDSIVFINPPNDAKKHGREIDRLQAFDKRVEDWQALAKRRGFQEYYAFQTFERFSLESQAIKYIE